MPDLDAQRPAFDDGWDESASSAKRGSRETGSQRTNCRTGCGKRHSAANRPTGSWVWQSQSPELPATRRKEGCGVHAETGLAARNCRSPNSSDGLSANCTELGAVWSRQDCLRVAGRVGRAVTSGPLSPKCRWKFTSPARWCMPGQTSSAETLGCSERRPWSVHDPGRSSNAAAARQWRNLFQNNRLRIPFEQAFGSAALDKGSCQEL
jgi:hypothetical protein